MAIRSRAFSKSSKAGPSSRPKTVSKISIPSKRRFHEENRLERTSFGDGATETRFAIQCTKRHELDPKRNELLVNEIYEWAMHHNGRIIPTYHHSDVPIIRIVGRKWIIDAPPKK